MNKPQIKASVNYEKAVEARVKIRLREMGERIQENRVTVGIPVEYATTAKTDYKQREHGASVIDVMIAHEFGIKVPERSWFRSWFDGNANRLKLEAIAAKRREFRGDKSAITNLAIKWARDLRAWVTTGAASLTPLAESTIKSRIRAGLREGPPLFATGQFVQSIRALVDGVDVGP